MRIALYVHCFFPAHFYGTEAYTLALAKGLQALGHDVTVVSATFAGEPAQASLVEERVYEGIRVLSIDKNHYPNRRVRDGYEQPTLRQVHERILRKIRPDVVHVCHLISHTTALLEVTARLGILTFATLTDFFGVCYTNKLEDARGDLCAGPDASRAGCIACFLKLAAGEPNPDPLARLANLPVVRPIVSQGLAWLGRSEESPFSISGFYPNDIVARPDLLRRACGVYREAIAPSRFLLEAYERNGFPAPLRLSHFGIEIDRSPKPPRPEGTGVRLGFIGQLVPHKGAHILLEALRVAGRENLSLTVWGPHDQDRAYFERLRRGAEGLPVRFPGTLGRSELATALGSVDYLVIPSTWYENSPLILLQALATHTPVIVSDVLGMTEFVEHGYTGFHFARGDAGALAAVLREIADKPERASRMSAGTAYPRTPEDMVADVVGLYADHRLDPVPPVAPHPAASPAPADGAADRGIEGPFEPWLKRNLSVPQGGEPDGSLAPFAPADLMTRTTGLENPRDFASHGVAIMRALAAASPTPLADHRTWLDFGVGVGRVARLFKGFTGLYAGVDIDPETVAWVREHLPWVRAFRTVPRQRLPFPDETFEAVVSISVFTHMGEADQRFYLEELHRVSRPGARLMLTVHGQRAAERALAEPRVIDLLSVPSDEIAAARESLRGGRGFHFTRQAGHLTTEDYAYGITFVGRPWIDAVWSQWFDVVDVVEGGIHDFQDIVVMQRRP